MIARILNEKYILRSNQKDLYYTVCKFGSLNMASNMDFHLSDGKPAPWFYGEGKDDDGNKGKFICFAYRLKRSYYTEESTEDIVCFVFKYDDIEYDGSEEPECSADIHLGKFPKDDKDCARHSSGYARTLIKKASLLPFLKIPDFLYDNDAYGHDWRKPL